MKGLNLIRLTRHLNMTQPHFPKQWKLLLETWGDGFKCKRTHLCCQLSWRWIHLRWKLPVSLSESRTFFWGVGMYRKSGGYWKFLQVWISVLHHTYPCSAESVQLDLVEDFWERFSSKEIRGQHCRCRGGVTELLLWWGMVSSLWRRRLPSLQSSSKIHNYETVLEHKSVISVLI